MTRAFTSMTRTVTACATLALTLLGGSRTVLADDTEIFLNRPSASSDVPPNVLFVLDTSFSMNTDVEVPASSPGGAPATYNAGTLYQVGGGCARDRIYWRGTRPDLEPPSDCSTLPSVSVANFTCDFLAKDIGSSGRVYGNFSVIGAASTKVAEWTTSAANPNSR